MEGFDSETGQTFQYICQHVVLATGATDSPNRLHVEGESNQPEWVMHRLGDLERALDTLSKGISNCILFFSLIFLTNFFTGLRFFFNLSKKIKTKKNIEYLLYRKFKYIILSIFYTYNNRYLEEGSYYSEARVFHCSQGWPSGHSEFG